MALEKIATWLMLIVTCFILSGCFSSYLLAGKVRRAITPSSSEVVKKTALEKKFIYDLGLMKFQAILTLEIDNKKLTIKQNFGCIDSNELMIGRARVMSAELPTGEKLVVGFASPCKKILIGNDYRKQFILPDTSFRPFIAIIQAQENRNTISYYSEYNREYFINRKLKFLSAEIEILSSDSHVVEDRFTGLFEARIVRPKTDEKMDYYYAKVLKKAKISEEFKSLLEKNYSQNTPIFIDFREAWGKEDSWIVKYFNIGRDFHGFLSSYDILRYIGLENQKLFSDKKTKNSEDVVNINFGQEYLFLTKEEGANSSLFSQNADGELKFSKDDLIRSFKIRLPSNSITPEIRNNISHHIGLIYDPKDQSLYRLIEYSIVVPLAVIH